MFMVVSNSLFFLSLFFISGVCFPSRLPVYLTLIVFVTSIILAGRGKLFCATTALLVSGFLAGSAVNLSGISGSRQGIPTEGIFRGEVSTVTIRGAMLDTEDGRYWISNRYVAGSVTRGDSLVVLGSCKHPPYLEAWTWETGHVENLPALIRNSLVQSWKSKIQSRQAFSMISALVVGDRSNLPSVTRELFHNTGTEHLLAVSGFHVGIIAGISFLFSRMIFGKKIISYLPVFILIWIYTLLTGSRTSTLRAAVMVSAGLILFRMFGSKINYLAIWGGAALLVVIMNPSSIYDAGAQMSFAAALALILLGKRFAGRFSWVKGIVVAGIIVTVSLAPLISATYGTVRIQAPLATVISMPFLLAVMMLSIPVIIPGVGPAAARLLEWVVYLWFKSLELFCFPGITLPEGLHGICLWLLLLLFIFFLFKRYSFTKRFR